MSDSKRRTASTVFRINKQSSWFFPVSSVLIRWENRWIRECETFSFSQSCHSRKLDEDLYFFAHCPFGQCFGSKLRCPLAQPKRNLAMQRRKRSRLVSTGSKARQRQVPSVCPQSPRSPMPRRFVRMANCDGSRSDQTAALWVDRYAGVLEQGRPKAEPAFG